MPEQRAEGQAVTDHTDLACVLSAWVCAIGGLADDTALLLVMATTFASLAAVCRRRP